MRNVVFSLCALMLIVGCDDSSPGGTKVFGIDRDMALPGQDMGVAPDMMVTPPVMRRNRLVVQGAADIPLFQGESAMLSVRYLDADGLPIANAEVTLGPEDPNQAIVSIRARGVRTDAQGTATFEVTAQNMNGRSRLKAEAANADPAFWIVRVAENPNGEVAVRVTYDDAQGRYTNGCPQNDLRDVNDRDGDGNVMECAPTCADANGNGQIEPAECQDVNVDIQTVKVKLLEGDCASAFSVVQGRWSADGPDISPFDGDDFSVFNMVPVGRTFAVVATGENWINRSVVIGCTDGHTATGGQRLEVEVPLEDQPLEFKGVYNVEHRLNLTEMLQNGDEDAAEFIEILEIFAAIGGGAGDGPFFRGEAVIELLCDRIGIDRGVCTILSTIGAAPVHDLIEDNAPPEVLQVLDVLGDVFRNFSDLTIEGEMEFVASYPDEEGYLRDNNARWQRIRFTWRNGCPFDQPEQCVRSFDLAENNGGRDSPIQADFDARLTDADTLLISRHQMGLNYGLFIILALEEWILPLITEEAAPVPLERLFEQIINCQELNAALPPNDPMSGLCENAILPPLAALLRNQLLQINDGLEVLTLEGQVRIADTYPNLKVDWLYDGLWNGWFGNAEERENPEDLIPDIGIFSGCRNTECELAPEPASMR